MASPRPRPWIKIIVFSLIVRLHVHPPSKADQSPLDDLSPGHTQTEHHTSHSALKNTTARVSSILREEFHFHP